MCVRSRLHHIGQGSGRDLGLRLALLARKVVRSIVRTDTHPGAEPRRVRVVTDSAMPWFPNENRVPSGEFTVDSGDVIALVAEAEYLLSAVSGEIQRARDLRDGCAQLRDWRLRRDPSSPRTRSVLVGELDVWRRRRGCAVTDLEALERLPAVDAAARGIDGAHAWLDVCERKQAEIQEELDSWPGRG